MKALFIGGTGTISMAIVRKLAEDPQWEVWLLNRGRRKAEVPDGIHQITADVHDETAAAKALEGLQFDTVCEFIAFHPDDAERDIRLFRGKTKQYIIISSASAYHKPAADYLITEGTTLANPHWEYSRNKIAIEEVLMKAYREEGFPVTVVRPSHTYDERNVPLGVHGNNGSWQVVKRMLEGKPVIIQGDGSSLWTMTFNTDFVAEKLRYPRSRLLHGLLRGKPRTVKARRIAELLRKIRKHRRKRLLANLRCRRVIQIDCRLFTAHSRAPSEHPQSSRSCRAEAFRPSASRRQTSDLPAPHSSGSAVPSRCRR